MTAASHRNKPPGLGERRQFCSPPPLDDGSLAHPLQAKGTCMSEHTLTLQGGCHTGDPGAATHGVPNRHDRRTDTQPRNALSCPWEFGGSLDVVNVHLLAAGTALVTAVRVAVLVELEATVAVLATAEVVRLVDLGGLGELSVCLERAGLVCCVLEAARGITSVSLGLSGKCGGW